MNLEFDNLKNRNSIKTLKGLYQSLQQDTKNINQIQIIKNRIRRVQETFNNFWHMDEYLFKKQFYEYVSHCKKQNNFDVINFAEIDKYWHLKTNATKNDKKTFETKTTSEIYRILYYMTFEPLFATYSNKYILGYVVDEQYICYIIFNEEDILNVKTILSQNMYDLNERIFLSDVDLKGKIFTKVSDLEQNK